MEMRIKATEPAAFFPLFVDMRGEKVLVLGGGKVAERRIQILLPFGAVITVISPAASAYIAQAAAQGTVRLLARKYESGDITNLRPFLVVAATDERQANDEARREAVRLGIPVSVADAREGCTCCFPALAESKAYIAGLISKNNDHAGVRRMAKKIRELLGE